ncbi:hypothetical protein TEQG_06147 [Trichophyton equinum CBS 127.97]|uniref:Uncharacterized protein n=1 Tax=Trichophyton equinum (strain ATCC MYA-4606 / CBS 127.97) TaxID=559882 RepID=F2PZ41_TRIEC|nr:hypothetical protein TEQG_06147 [Trichophyton equinum CBS 127.97]
MNSRRVSTWASAGGQKAIDFINVDGEKTRGFNNGDRWKFAAVRGSKERGRGLMSWDHAGSFVTPDSGVALGPETGCQCWMAVERSYCSVKSVAGRCMPAVGIGRQA